MTLTLPNLDDRTYTDLVDEAIALIPNVAPEWTNHNPSDPGITLIELFAYFTDLLLYRQNQITDESLLGFLKLLNGPEWVPIQPLEEEIRRAVLQVRDRYRAITLDDFESLSLADADVARAHALPRRNLETSGEARNQDAPAHISVVVVPEPAAREAGAENLEPSDEMLQRIVRILEPRRLLTTQVHAVGPRYVPIGVRFRLVPTEATTPDEVEVAAIGALQQFFDPLTGGAQQQGWPFGRSVYVSELYDLLDRLPGVDYVTPVDSQDELILRTDLPDRLARNADNALIAITLQPDELIELQLNRDDWVIEPATPVFSLS